MKLVSNGSELYITTDNNQNPVAIRKKVGRQTDLSKLQTQWNLSNLVNIITNDTLQNDQSRIDAQYKRDIAINMMLGAITGGVIDNMIGDDSIINGVLIGTAFGAIATNKKNPVAQVGLIFTDGESIAVEVDKHEYSTLQTFCIGNLKQIQDGSQSVPTKEHVKHNEQEYEAVASQRKIWAFLGIVILFFGMLLFIFSSNFLLGDGTSGLIASSSVHSDSSQGNIAPQLGADIMPVMFFVTIFLAVGFLAKIMFTGFKKPSDFIKPNENNER